MDKMTESLVTKSWLNEIQNDLIPKSILYFTSLMEQRALNNVNSCWNIDISFYLETSGGQSCNLYFNVVNFFNTSVNWTSVAA